MRHLVAGSISVVFNLFFGAPLLALLGIPLDYRLFIIVILFEIYGRLIVRPCLNEYLK